MVNIRHNFIRPVTAVILGIIGAILRKIELSTVFSSATGLALVWQPITIALVSLSAIAVAAFIVLSLGVKKLKVDEGYAAAMTSDNQFLFILSLVSVFGIACASVLYYFENKTILAMLLTVFGLVATLALTYISRPRSKSSEGDGNAAANVLFVIFICFWMVLEYKARSADPVLLDYVYDFLALCAAAMAFYYKTGFAFDRPNPLKTIAFMQIALYFCIIAVPGANGIAQMIFFSSFALLMIRDMLVLGGNLTEKE